MQRKPFDERWSHSWSHSGIPTHRYVLSRTKLGHDERRNSLLMCLVLKMRSRLLIIKIKVQYEVHNLKFVLWSPRSESPGSCQTDLKFTIHYSSPLSHTTCVGRKFILVYWKFPFEKLTATWRALLHCTSIPSKRINEIEVENKRAFGNWALEGSRKSPLTCGHDVKCTIRKSV